MTAPIIPFCANSQPRWEEELKRAITSPQELLTLLELDPELLPAAEQASRLFELKVPRGFVARMTKGDPNDPLLRQILPLAAEMWDVPGFSADPLSETLNNPLPGLLHKYAGRVLFTLAGTCAVNCRYCFRRHFSYSDNNPGSQGWDKVIAYITNDPSIVEVIFSGGDPLITNDRTLELLTDKLAKIPHLKRLRIHTRLPIVLPERICPEFISWLASLTLKPIIVVHCNHPQEIDSSVLGALAKLSAAGAVLLNQAVLLKGVNDSVDVLRALSEKLFAAGVMPYYLHVLDKVQGSAHFDSPRELAIRLHTELGQQLSGYLVPKLVYEQSGALAKISLTQGIFYTGESF